MKTPLADRLDTDGSLFPEEAGKNNDHSIAGLAEGCFFFTEKQINDTKLCQERRGYDVLRDKYVYLVVKNRFFSLLFWQLPTVLRESNKAVQLHSDCETFAQVLASPSHSERNMLSRF